MWFKILDIGMTGILGLVLMALWAFCIVGIDWFFEHILKKEIPLGLFNMVVWASVFIGGWVLCYGMGALFIHTFFR